MYERISQFFGRRYMSYWAVLAIDTIASAVCSIVACLVANHFSLPAIGVNTILLVCAISCIVSVFSFMLFHTYRNIIRHSTFKDIWQIFAAVLVKTVLLFFIIKYAHLLTNKQLLIAALFDWMFTAVSLVAMRIVMIFCYDALMSRIEKKRLRILVYGVRDKSVALKARLNNSPHYKISGYLNFGKEYKSYMLSGLRVFYFENENDFKNLTSKYHIDGVLFPSYETARLEKERLVRYCENLGKKVLISPPVNEIDGNKLFKAGIREIRIEDLLGRDEIQISLSEIINSFRGKTIMVTGAAGSIGSELCRQLATFGIGRLIIIDNAETPMHNIRLELENKFPNLNFTPYIGDVRSKKRLRVAFERYCPHVVFHAAAYKHVPLMEENPCEAAMVNDIGTRNLADLCVEYGVEKMVMISTDKAVNPTNVMGASKRLAEIYVQSLGVAIHNGHIKGHTQFVTTRFGNVLGSNGSVIPLFRAQIEKGGPVTVTHPDIVRFFMTIPEACRLVMEAAVMNTENKICVFDMGEAVKIVDLAKRMISLAGYRPNEDIKIEYTGLRPGEKLYEEVLSNEENTVRTSHEKIRIAKVREYDYESVAKDFDTLLDLAENVKVEETVKLLKRIIPEFKSRNSQYEYLDAVIEEEQAKTA